MKPDAKAELDAVIAWLDSEVERLSEQARGATHDGHDAQATRILAARHFARYAASQLLKGAHRQDVAGRTT